MEGAGRTWTRRVPITVSEIERLALNARHGKKGMATITETVHWLLQQGDGVMDDVVYEYRTGQAKPGSDDE